MNWYEITNVDEIDSPALVVYPDRVRHNIELAIQIAGDKNRLRPHVKTHKMPALVQIHVLEYGITKFKCATIAEAEMIAQNGGTDILLAHQPTRPKIKRLLLLVQQFPNIDWGVIVDNLHTINDLETAFADAGCQVRVLLDINNGMDRSGIRPNQQALQCCQQIVAASYLKFGGLHVYDGQFRSSDFEARREAANHAFESVNDFIGKLQAANLSVPSIIVGGSPTFPVHALRANVELSPGTYVFWDKCYMTKAPELGFLPAALVLTRVISQIDEKTVCLDLGHKSIASENPHPNRVSFFKETVEDFATHSEEHLVIKTPNASQLPVNAVLYGLPYHICPTVNLHQQAALIEDNKYTGEWKILARDRCLTV